MRFREVSEALEMGCLRGFQVRIPRVPEKLQEVSWSIKAFQRASREFKGNLRLSLERFTAFKRHFAIQGSRGLCGVPESLRQVPGSLWRILEGF